MKALAAQIIRSIKVYADRITIEFFVSGLLRILDCDVHTDRDATFELECTYELKRKGNQARLIIDNESGPKAADKDEALIRAVAKAHVWNRMLIEGTARSMREIGRSEGVTERYIRKVLPLAHLAPDIVSCICEGQQPRDLTLNTFVYSSIPNGWSDQRQKYGFRTA